MMRNRRLAAGPLAWALAAVLAGAWGCNPADVAEAVSDALADCSPAGQNQFVRTTLRDVYYWYRELPDPDPATFSSPEAYLEAVRYKTLDHTYSFITGRAENDAFFSDSQFIGFGFSYQVTSGSELRLTEVYPASPASEAGLERGARLLAVNGRPVGSLLSTGDINTVFGPSQVGVTAQVRFRDNAGVEREAQMTKRTVTIPTASLTRTFASGGRVVGYVNFRNFVTPATAALNQAFTELEAAGANELVLDLRYNGGGLVSVANHLAGLIGGSRTSGKLFVQFVHNDKNTSRNSTVTLTAPAHALNLERLVVIQTRASASASELIVNGLRPFMTVTTVGDRSYGKPVGQYGYNFCEKVLYPVAFSTQNARGEGDYYNGIAADCGAADDLDHQLGDSAEASLGEALRFLRTGSCNPAASALARAQAAQRPPVERDPRFRDGWQALIGAY
jgi:C-terminal processing protease CtpA/Prc